MSPSEKKATKAAHALSFEQSLGELEQIVSRLEAGQLGLDESLTQYQLGVERLKFCHALLTKAERRVRILQGLDEDGGPITDSFDNDDMTLDEKSRNRSQRRSSEAKAEGTKHRTPRNSVDASEELF